MALDVECSGCRRGLTAGEDVPCGPSEGTEGPGCPSLCPLKDSDPDEGTGSVPWAWSAGSGLSWAEIPGFAPYKSIPTPLTRGSPEGAAPELREQLSCDLRGSLCSSGISSRLFRARESFPGSQEPDKVRELLWLIARDRF